MTDIDAIRENHEGCGVLCAVRRNESGGLVTCQVNAVLTAWDELLADRNAILERLIKANGDADRLGEALRHNHYVMHTADPCGADCDIGEALRLHDEAKG